MVERQVWSQAEGPSVGSKPLGVPLGRLVDLVPPAVRQLSLLGNVVFLCFLL